MTIGEFYYKNFNKIFILERISVLLLFIGFVLQYFNLPLSKNILTLAAIMFFITYYLLSRKRIGDPDYKPKGLFDSFGFINSAYFLSYGALSLASFAILIQAWKAPIFPFTKYMIGLLLLSLFLSAISKGEAKPLLFNSTFYVRMLLWLLFWFYVVN